MRPRMAPRRRHPEFLKLWAGRTVSRFGSQVKLVALPLVAAIAPEVTPAQMGVLGAVQFAPFLLFGLVAGVRVDRPRRRPIMIDSGAGARSASVATVAKSIRR
ncbi:MAG: hypothetical protein M3O34_18420 [Chloroflexota bacterium]|nr:hypothetical protein [Chloroflexota bacterium]